MENRSVSREYTRIGQELISSEDELRDLRDSNARIIFLSSDYERKSAGKPLYGICEKVQDKHKWSIEAEFTITLFEPNISNMTDDQIRILLFHELLHAGVDHNEDGEEKYVVRPHDLEDFRVIIDKYGTDWAD